MASVPPAPSSSVSGSDLMSISTSPTLLPSAAAASSALVDDMDTCGVEAGDRGQLMEIITTTTQPPSLTSTTSPSSSSSSSTSSSLVGVKRKEVSSSSSSSSPSSSSSSSGSCAPSSTSSSCTTSHTTSSTLASGGAPRPTGGGASSASRPEAQAGRDEGDRGEGSEPAQQRPKPLVAAATNRKRSRDNGEEWRVIADGAFHATNEAIGDTERPTTTTPAAAAAAAASKGSEGSRLESPSSNPTAKRRKKKGDDPGGEKQSAQQSRELPSEEDDEEDNDDAEDDDKDAADGELLHAILSPSPVPMVDYWQKEPRPQPQRGLTRFSAQGPLLFSEHYITQVVEREWREYEREKSAAERLRRAYATGAYDANPSRSRRSNRYDYDDDDSWAIEEDEEDEEGDSGDDVYSPKRRFDDYDYPSTSTTTTITSSYFDSLFTMTTTSSSSNVVSLASGKRRRRVETSPSPDSAGEEPDDGNGETRSGNAGVPGAGDDDESTQEDSLAPASHPSHPALNIDPSMEAGQTDDSDEDTQPME